MAWTIVCPICKHVEEFMDAMGMDAFPIPEALEEHHKFCLTLGDCENIRIPDSPLKEDPDKRMLQQMRQLTGD